MLARPGPGAAGATGGAFAGALAATLLVFGLARGDSSLDPQTRLLLTGVIVASGCGAAVALIHFHRARERSCAACCSG
jgi:iron complex transport system permease protein